MFLDYFRIVMLNLTHRRVRTWLTVLGVVIGITAVVALISIGQGVKDSINEQFRMMGTDKIMIMPKTLGLGGTTLTNIDLDAIKKVNGVEGAAGMISKTAPVIFGKELKYTYVGGVPTDKSRKIVEEMKNMKTAQGRLLRANEHNKVVIGQLVAKGELFSKKVRIGDELIINGEKFKVIGVFDSFGNQEDDSSVIISLDDAARVLNSENSYFLIIAKALPGIKPSEVSPLIEKKLRQLHNVKEGAEDFTVQTTDELSRTYGVIITIVQVIFIGIAAISLFVGGVGIMNSMYTAVLERIKEIGIMKAVGAKISNILLLFLMESGLLGLVGGVIGVISGVLLSKGVERIALLKFGTSLVKAHISSTLIIGSLLFAFLIGMLSGLAPAIQASRLKPVDALRFRM
ncbi:MAG: FtsX-like permease family protein [Nitrospiraceae bacterium]|nr:FtsX-like permease family protein [Nitrospiraceae bacterium]